MFYSFRKQIVLLFLLLSGHLPAQADELKYLPTGESSLLQRSADILGARNSIDILTYQFSPCEMSSRHLVHLLGHMASKGVRVRLILDAHIPSLQERADVTAMFAKRNIEVRFFNSVMGILDKNIDFRIHAKLMVVDSRSYITGGRNLNDSYFSLSPNINYLDRDVRVQGSSAAQAQEHFDRLWDSSRVRAVAPSHPGALASFEHSCLGRNPAGDNQLLDYLRERGQARLRAYPSVSCANVAFYLDDESFNNFVTIPSAFVTDAQLAHKSSTQAIVNLLDRASRSLQMENWLYIPTARIDSSLANLRARGVPVGIYTNMVPSRSNVLIAEHTDAALRHNQGSQSMFLLSPAGGIADRWAFTPTGRRGDQVWWIHSKTMVIDGKHSVVSSFNLDPRSYGINIESALVARNCPAFASVVLAQTKALHATFEADGVDCAHCRQIPWTSVFAALFGSILREYL